MMDDKLFLAPLRNPKDILECGYGQGTWAVAMAEMFPDSNVSKDLATYNERWENSIPNDVHHRVNQIRL
jgi:ribosomal protein RSM22 (predicted rRNA methylase)